MIREYLENYFEAAALRGVISTPCIVYSQRRLAENITELLDCLQQTFDGGRAFFAVKACPFIWYLRMIRAAGLGVEVQSLEELETVDLLEFPPDMIICNGVGKRSDYMRKALERGALLIADSAMEVDYVLDHVNRHHIPRVGIRVNMGGDHGSRFSANTKLGMDRDDALHQLERCSLIGVKVVLHIHVMSRARSHADVVAALGTFAAWMSDIPISLLSSVEVINIGGGLDCRLNMTASGSSLENVFAGLSDLFSKLVCEKEIWIECGRYFVEDGAIALSGVNLVKLVGGVKWVVVDVGTNFLIPIPSADYSVVQPWGEGPRECVNVADGICSPAAKIGNDCDLPLLSVGEAVVVLKCGSYTYSLAENFGFCIPPGYLLNKGVGRCIFSKRLAKRIWEMMFSSEDFGRYQTNEKNSEVALEEAILVSEDLVFRDFRLSDAECVYESFVDSAMVRYTENIPWPYALSDALEWIGAMGQTPRGSHIWAINLRGDSRVIGAIELSINEREEGKVKYWINADYQRRGYAKQAVTKVINYALEFLKVSSVFAEVHPENIASRRVLLSCGFEPVGVCRGEFEVYRWKQ